MKNKIISIVAFSGTVIYLGASFYWDILPKWITIIPFAIGVLPTILSFIEDKKEVSFFDKMEKNYQKIVEEQGKLLESQEGEKIKLKKDRERIEGVLSDINLKLNEENISKKDLIKDLNNNLEVVLLIKHAEGEKNKPKPIRDALKERGFRSINYGMWILPPSLTPHFNKSKKLEDWIDRNFLNKISKEYRYKISVMIVDLKKIFVKEQGETRMKSLIEKIDYTDFIKLEKLDNYLKQKKDISLMDIIQIPSLIKLVNKGNFGWHDGSTLNKEQRDILEEIKKHLGKQELKTKDLSKVNKGFLKELLKNKGLRNYKEISSDIIKNSEFWGQL